MIAAVDVAGNGGAAAPRAVSVSGPGIAKSGQARIHALHSLPWRLTSATKLSSCGGVDMPGHAHRGARLTGSALLSAEPDLGRTARHPSVRHRMDARRTRFITLAPVLSGLVAAGLCGYFAGSWPGAVVIGAIGATYSFAVLSNRD